MSKAESQGHSQGYLPGLPSFFQELVLTGKLRQPSIVKMKLTYKFFKKKTKREDRG
jgi:hypothetical protein